MPQTALGGKGPEDTDEQSGPEQTGGNDGGPPRPRCDRRVRRHRGEHVLEGGFQTVEARSRGRSRASRHTPGYGAATEEIPVRAGRARSPHSDHRGHYREAITWYRCAPSRHGLRVPARLGQARLAGGAVEHCVHGQALRTLATPNLTGDRWRAGERPTDCCGSLSRSSAARSIVRNGGGQEWEPERRDGLCARRSRSR